MKIALLEDDPDQRGMFEMWLTEAGHEVDGFEVGAAFLDAVKSHTYDMAVVDWLLPDYDGGRVIRWVRESLGWELPIVVVTIRDDEKDIVAGLEAGADDYLTKPVRPMELLARLQVLARRVKPRVQMVLHAGAYEIDTERCQLRLRGEPIKVTQKELDLAHYLFSNPGKLFSRVNLLEAVWGLRADVDTRTVDTHVSRLRRKLKLSEENGWVLEPVYGFGYRLAVAGGDPAP